MTYVNRVWDTVAAGFVRWRTNAPDEDGLFYPGPGSFGANTSDYCIESDRDEQSIVRPVAPSLSTPIGTVQGLWLFDGDLTDETPNAINLSATGTERYSPSPAQGKLAHFFTGDRVVSPASSTSDPIRLTGAMTLECVLNPSIIATDPNMLFANFQAPGGGTANNTLYGFRILQTTNELEYIHEDAGEVIRSAMSGVSVPPGRWSHCAFTRDAAGTLIRIYINGVQVHRETLANPPSGGANSFLQVGDADGISRKLTGAYSSLRIIDDELRPEHILASARAALSPEARP
jgi:hypothetical protein